MTDRLLMQKFTKDRDQACFAELVHRHGAMVLATARRLARDDAEDVAQAVFLLLAQRAGRLAQHENLAGWLYETTRHCARNANRTRRRRLARIAAAQEAAVTDSISSRDNSALLEQLDDGLARLSGTYKQVLIMRYMEDQSVEETAAQLGITPAAFFRFDKRLS
jgi:RNA polymerase sigma factor (sigma-70 family)